MLRLPKKRGFRNKPKSPKYLVFNLSDIVPHLAPLTAEGKPVLLDMTLLAAIGLIEKTSRSASVKILGSGEIKSAITVKGLSVSKEARAKIEKAGGKVE
jgi:large subunit ribosomal protein L15